jgi:Fe-S oxidoreductase
VVDGAEKLKVKTVISPECGHAYMALRWEGPDLIGRKYPFKVIHILDLLEELRTSGRLRMTGRETDRLTFHDPCQIVRRGGVLEAPRNLLREVADDFVDMHEHGKWNWCCGGGGGVSSNERAEGLKLKAFNVKRRQLQELGVDRVVTACANCRLTFEDGLEEYDMDLPVVGLTEVIAEHLVEDEPKAEKAKAE